MVVPTNIVCGPCGDTYYYQFLTSCVFLSNNITCTACVIVLNCIVVECCLNKSY